MTKQTLITEAEQLEALEPEAGHMANTIILKRTGAKYSFSSVQWEVTYPDGVISYIWSPPWSDLDYDDPKQDEGALRYAQQQWEEKTHGGN